MLRGHQLSLMAADRSMTAQDNQAHQQFARDYAEHIRIVRDALGASPAQPGSVT